jgi:hypothetical protein
MPDQAFPIDKRTLDMESIDISVFKAPSQTSPEDRIELVVLRLIVSE